MTMNKNSILIDMMLGNHHECQIDYPLNRCSIIDCGDRVIPVINERQLAAFIESKRPSLKGKDYHVEFTNQKV